MEFPKINNAKLTVDRILNGSLKTLAWKLIVALQFLSDFTKAINDVDGSEIVVDLLVASK
ncbi:MAG: hypothetical protein QW348_03680 [Ignisphaera sp.]